MTRFDQLMLKFGKYVSSLKTLKIMDNVHTINVIISWKITTFSPDGQYKKMETNATKREHNLCYILILLFKLQCIVYF